MRSHRRRFTEVVMASTLLFTGSLALADDGAGIGFYTAVSGRVSVMHPHQAQVIPVTLHDQVLFKDVIQTQSDSRTKAFFHDDSILTVGEKSRIEINEYIYKPDDNVRKAVVTLLEGQVRALVSKVFKANGSKFEVHTPSAVAAARGTYFTVWAENGQSGIINIGETGRVDFTSGGTTVAVDPGYFSVASNGQAPSVPLKHHVGETLQGGTKKSIDEGALLDPHRDGALEDSNLEQADVLGLPQALAAVRGTSLSDGVLAELPSELLQVMNVDTHLVTTLMTMVGAPTTFPGGILSGTVQGDSTETSLLSVSAGVGSTSVTAAVGPVNAGPVSVGPVSVGPVSVGPISTAPISVGPVSVGPIAVAPVTLAPAVVAPMVSLPTLTVPVPLPVAPITVGPVSVVPTAPVLPVTPPAVINGALNLLGQ